AGVCVRVARSLCGKPARRPAIRRAGRRGVGWRRVISRWLSPIRCQATRRARSGVARAPAGAGRADAAARPSAGGAGAPRGGARAHLGGVQRQTVESEALAEQAVVLAFAVFRVADDRVARVFEVAADLVKAARQRPRFVEAVALEPRQQLELGDGGARLSAVR